MNFKELIEQTEWAKVAEFFHEYYGLDYEEIKHYKKIYFKLFSYEPEENIDNITIITEEDDDCINVVGVNDEGRYAIDFCSWEEWLGFNVKVENMSNEEYVAHCLDEMTFYGDEEDVKKIVDDIERTIDKIDNKQYVTYESDCPFCEDGIIKSKDECVCEDGKIKIMKIKETDDE